MKLSVLLEAAAADTPEGSASYGYVATNEVTGEKAFAPNVKELKAVVRQMLKKK